jgi:hypothetical protein
MFSFIVDFFVNCNGWIILFATPFFALLGGLIPAWTIFLLFLISRLADYVTTLIGLSAGAIETNPVSEARELTGFWENFFRWFLIFGALTLIAQFVGPLFLESMSFGEKSVNINWIQVIVSLPILGYSLLSFSAAINNLIVSTSASLGVASKGASYATTFIALILLVGLLLAIIAISGQWGLFTSLFAKES